MTALALVFFGNLFPVKAAYTLSQGEAETIGRRLYTGSGTLTDTEIEKVNGLEVYAIEFTEADGNEVDVKINAVTGALVAIEDDRTDTDNDLNDEAGDDDADEERISTTAQAAVSRAKLVALEEQVVELLRQLLVLLEQRS